MRWSKSSKWYCVLIHHGFCFHRWVYVRCSMQMHHVEYSINSKSAHLCDEVSRNVSHLSLSLFRFVIVSLWKTHNNLFHIHKWARFGKHFQFFLRQKKKQSSTERIFMHDICHRNVSLLFFFILFFFFVCRCSSFSMIVSPLQTVWSGLVCHSVAFMHPNIKKIYIYIFTSNSMHRIAGHSLCNDLISLLDVSH